MREKCLGWGALAVLIPVVMRFLLFWIRQWEEGRGETVLSIFVLGVGAYCFRLCVQRMKQREKQ